MTCIIILSHIHIFFKVFCMCSHIHIYFIYMLLLLYLLKQISLLFLYIVRKHRDDMQVNVAGLRRNIKNLAHNYSEAQVNIYFNSVKMKLIYNKNAVL